GAAIDYGNQTIAASDAARSNARAVTLRGLPGVAVDIGRDATSNFVPLFALSNPPEAQPICAGAGGVASRAIRVPFLPGGRVLAMTTRYRADTTGAWISVSRGVGEPGNFSMQLPSGDRTSVRLFALPSAATNLSIVTLIQGSPGAACLRVRDLAIGEARSSGAWRLLGTPIDLFVTSPYAAAHEASLILPADRPYLNGSARSTGAVPWSALAASAFWSLPESVGGTTADVHAVVDRAIPGMPYEVRIPLRGWTGSLPRIAILAQDDEVLDDSPAPRENRRGNVIVTVDNPPSSGRLQIYLYAGAAFLRQAGAMLGVPSATPISRPDVIAWRLGSDLPVPTAMQARQIDGADYVVRVTGAPARYLLVLNDSFSPGWKVAAPPGVRATHLVTNLDTNGWVIAGVGSYELVLSYDGEKYAREGIVFSVLLLIAAAALHLAPRLISK
ncbi:MAG TPA: hypothetical protein VIN40_01325, partial [Candidatus Tyrphobacter sp.]